MAQPFEWPSYTQTVHRSSYPAIDPTNPKNSAAGKVVVVTGGGSGIGRGIAEAFVHAGAKAVAILGRRANVLAEAKTALDQLGSQTEILTFQADVVDERALNAAFAGTAAAAGPVDIAVANAGYLSDPSAAAEADVDEWFKGFEINIKGTLLTFRAFAAHKAARDPVFIALSTAAAHFIMPTYSAYGVSKLGQLHLVSYLHAENPGVRVVQYHPGVLATDMMSKGGMQISTDDMSLPTSYAVWLASAAADWTRGLYLWAHWDVDELAALKEQITKDEHLRVAISGFPQVLQPTVA